MIKQRGSGAGLFIVYLFFRLFGYYGLRFVLFFVVFYFSITTPALKRSLREYYKYCTGKFNFLIYYRHLFSFALVFSDRFLSKRFLRRYHLEIKIPRPFLPTSDKGLLFCLSHVGDWSTAELIPSEYNTPINIVMHEAVKNSIKSFEKSIEVKHEKEIKVIDLSEGPIAVAIHIAKAFQNGEIVAMMADRYLTREQSVPVTFLGKRVRINKNPFEVAYNRNVPIIAFISLRVKDYHYSTYYYSLSPYDRTLPKEDAIAAVAQEYAAILENIVKAHPNQWFNHYDFFGVASTEL